MNKEADLLTTGDVARLADRTSDTVRHWARSGVLPAMRTVSGQRVFERATVERFLAAREKHREGLAWA